MTIAFTAETHAEVLTYDNSTWTTIESLTPFDASDQTYGGSFIVIARRDADGTSALWNKTCLVDWSSGTARIITNGIADIISPIKDTGALLWDVRVIVTNSDIQIQSKGGSNSQPVGWVLQGNVWGIYP